MEDQQNDIMVSICCTAYNHEKYIEQALEGFVMQQCNFKFEILISDDASTDNTASIINKYESKYPHLFKVFYLKENQYSKGNKPLFNILFPTAKGKYIALCEGDDYWTDPLKLQKQVDFLERNEEYVITSGGYIDNNEKQLLGINQNFELKDLPNKWYCKTLTILFRNHKIKTIDLKKYLYNRDIHLIYTLLKTGKGYYFNEIFGEYNRHGGGVFSSLTVSANLLLQYKIYKELHEYENSSISRKLLYNSTLHYGKYNFLYVIKSFLYIGSFSDLKSSIYNLLLYKKYG